MASLRKQYLDLLNNQLPAAAQEGNYPVQFNHCFARIILDTLCGCEWYQVIEKPAYQHMTDEQLKQAIALGEEFLADSQACFVANQKSLQYRDKLRKITV